MKGIKTNITTAARIAGAIIHLTDSYPTNNDLEGLWDEVISQDTWGNGELEWIYEIRQAERLGYGQSLFDSVKRQIRRRAKNHT